MRVILWIEMVLTSTVLTISGQKSGLPWLRHEGMRNPRCISCAEVKETHLCESCCKRPVCDPNPCTNDGMCSPDDNGYSCTCTPGYLGEHCDVNACLPNLCKNNGTCSPVDKGYICNCATGYLGENCDVNPCNIYNPCINNGTCYPSEFGVNCSCPPGFTGDHCQEKVCDEAKCNDSGGICALLNCRTDATNCGGKACNSGEVCIDDTCVNYSDNCDDIIDGINYICEDKGERCGVGQFCDSGYRCVNDTCRLRGVNCGGPPYTATSCSIGALSVTCSGDGCLISCNDNKDCDGHPCVGGACSHVKCGESFCFG